MAELNRSWEERLRNAEKMRRKNIELLERQGLRKIDNTLPTLINLNDDPQLSETLVYVISPGATTVGQGEDCDIQLGGVFVAERHAVLQNTPEHGLQLCAQPEAATYVNGKPVSESQPVELQHGDRIVFGQNHFFRLNVPAAQRGGSHGPDPPGSAAHPHKDYRFAKEELEQQQLARMQAELEAEMEAEKERFQAQLRAQQQGAQQLLARQQADFEARLQSLQSGVREEERQRIEQELRAKFAAEQAAEQARLDAERRRIEAAREKERKRALQQV